MQQINMYMTRKNLKYRYKLKKKQDYKVKFH